MIFHHFFSLLKGVVHLWFLWKNSKKTVRRVFFIFDILMTPFFIKIGKKMGKNNTVKRQETSCFLKKKYKKKKWCLGENFFHFCQKTVKKQQKTRFLYGLAVLLFWMKKRDFFTFFSPLNTTSFEKKWVNFFIFSKLCRFSPFKSRF